MKFLQTKPQVKNMNIIYYDLFYTVIRIIDKNRYIDNRYENSFNDFIITPNNYLGSRPRETILR